MDFWTLKDVCKHDIPCWYAVCCWFGKGLLSFFNVSLDSMILSNTFPMHGAKLIPLYEFRLSLHLLPPLKNGTIRLIRETGTSLEIRNYNIDVTDIEKVLKTLKNNKATGFDNIFVFSKCSMFTSRSSFRYPHFSLYRHRSM
jgi:hypothetical protein